MKNKIKKISLLLLFVSSFAYAQIVNIPDANFKNTLLTTNCVDIDNDGIGDIDVDTNDDGEIQVTEAEAVLNLTFAQTNSVVILDLQGIQAFINLKRLNFSSVVFFNDAGASTNITMVDFTMLNQLEYLQLNNLATLFLEDINLSGLTNLIELVLSGIRLYNEDPVSFVNLDLNGCDRLESFNYYNSFLNIDFCQVPSLINLNCSYLEGGEPEVFDFSCLHNLQVLDISENAIDKLILKNGSSLTTISTFDIGNTYNYPNFICIDDIADSILLSNLIGSNTVINTYCSFTPGGDFNTISGNIVFDSDNNGCDSNDDVFPFIKLNINDGSETASTFTTNIGEYNFYTQDGDFTITPEFENPTFFSVTPIDATINFPDNNDNIATQDFCVTTNGIHPDVEIVIAPTIAAQPGLDAEYVITYKNKGNQTLSGNFSLAYEDTVLDYVSATETPTTQATSLITWGYVDLLPFESRSVYVILHVNEPTETPAINIGDELGFSVIINPIVGDELPNDNTFDYKQIVVGSYDPNNIICVEGDIVEPIEIGEYLHYIINFENTGNAIAQNIVIATEIDPIMFNINSVSVLSSSHDPYVKVTGNLVEVIFEAISLDTGGHGNILLKVQSQEDLQTEDTVTKNANIYYDYNFPIETNDANTTFQVLSTPDFELDNSINVYPNPVKDVLNISARNTIKSVSLFDVQGRLLQTKMNNTNELTIDVSSRASGIYFAKIVSDKGARVEKIIKQ